MVVDEPLVATVITMDDSKVMVAGAKPGTTVIMVTEVMEPMVANSSSSSARAGALPVPSIGTYV